MDISNRTKEKYFGILFMFRASRTKEKYFGILFMFRASGAI